MYFISMFIFFTIFLKYIKIVLQNIRLIAISIDFIN